MNFKKLCFLVLIACIVFGGGIYYFKNLPEQPGQERGIISETATHKLKLKHADLSGNYIGFEIEVINKTQKTLKFETEKLEFTFDGKTYNANGTLPDPSELEVPAKSRNKVNYFIQNQDFKKIKPGTRLDNWTFKLPLKKEKS